MTRYCTFTVLVLCVCNVSSQDALVVNTPMGSLRGYYMKTREGRDISAFTAIPFALEPVGELRFKEPVPVKPWQGVRDATQDTPACVGRNPYIRQGEIAGQEDCLYLNIYTPYTRNEDIQNNKKLPVMVFIHGGGWMCGDSNTDTYGPEYLLDHEIILVTTNYRLGPLGFLSTQDEHCPGNNGLKDQREALRFIQKTIESFGGDKDSVTIFGESAGGASVHYHMLSRSSIGLFQRAISESGTALVPWAEAPPGEAKVNAFKLAKFLDCPQAPSEAMIECLRTKDSYDIINTENRFYLWDYEPMTPFKAAVEPELPGAFLTQRPRDLHDVPAAVPWMTGLTKDEGCLKSVWITTNETRLKEFTAGFKTIAPVTFYYDNSPYEHVITKKIKQEYLKTDLESGILKTYTDSYFAYPAVEAVEQTLSYTKSPIYLYKLAYRATNSFSQIFGDPEGNHGVCHADDLMHLFPIRFLNKPESAKDEEIGKLIRTMWTNFAKSGDPNGPVDIPVKWEPITSKNKMKYLEIASEQSMKYGFAERSRFWGEMPLWHNLQPWHHDIQHHDEL